MADFKYVSLFAGIGGFDTALDSLGGECVLASEIDKWAAQSYELLYGTKPQGDVRKIHESDVPDHDILAFGFPCQSFSMAGKRLGMNEMRGTLFFEAARIAKEKQPKILFAENVKGLISHNKGETLAVIVNAMNEIGYVVDFEVLNSKHFGVPQSRERIFIIGVRKDLVEHEEWKIEKGRNDSVAKAKKQMLKEGTYKTFNFDFPKDKLVTKKLKDILEENVDEKYYLSQEKVDKLILKTGTTQQGYKQYTEETEATGTLLSNGGGLGGTAAGCLIEKSEVIGTLDIKGQDVIKRVYDTEGQSPTLTTMQGGGREPKILTVGNLYPSGGQAGVVVDPEGLSPTLDTCQGGNRQTKIIEEPTINCVNPRKDDGSQTYQQDRIYQKEGIVPALCANLADLRIEEKEGEIQVVGEIGNEGFEKTRRVYDTDGVSPTLIAGSGNTAETKILEKQPKLEKIGNIYPSGGQNGNVYSSNGLAPTLSSGSTDNKNNGGIGSSNAPKIVEETEYSVIDPRHREPKEKHDIVPTLCATDYKEPKNIIEKTTIKQIGYIDNKYKDKEMYNVHDTDGLSPTLTKNNSIYKLIGEEEELGNQPPKPTYRVRKLTPLECFRLQGFSDEAHDLLKENGISDTQRYKQAGNAVTVNVIKALGKKLIPYLEEDENE